MSQRTPVAVARGDGIGPEIMDAVLAILEAAGAPIEPRPVEMGERVYLAGHSAGLAPDALDTIRACKVLLKAPITTPSGGGYKSLNVTLRKMLGLYANLRPNLALDPFVRTAHPGMDVVIVRENEEDLYAGIEHRQTDEVFQCLKLITRPGCEKIVRYAFEYARRHGRKRVTCMVKDNIMKMTDGLFYRVFTEIAPEYPEIATDRMIIDIGAARLATRPRDFDVIVTLNLYGDILSDIAAEVAGSVGLAGSANIGEQASMFEAIHGSAPDIAGRDLANPSGLLQAAVQMLVHLGQAEVAMRVENAWRRTLEDGVHTADIRGPETREVVGTRAFAQAVIARLGQGPRRLRPAAYQAVAEAPAPYRRRHVPAAKTLVGVDVFLHQLGSRPEDLAGVLQAAAPDGMVLQMITNRGVKVWPGGLPETFCTDHWRCRFMRTGAAPLRHGDIVRLLERVDAAGLDFIKTENLCDFDNVPGYALGQGQ